MGSLGLTRPPAKRCGPHCQAAEISGELMEKEFHEMFKYIVEQSRKMEKKREKKKLKHKFKDKLKVKIPEFPLLPPMLTLPGNPSQFAVFAHVRQCVLERQMADAERTYLQLKPSNSDCSDSEPEDISPPAITVPKMVGVGVTTVLQLIEESRKCEPRFCQRALAALLDILEGQQPEEMRREPQNIIDSLFNLLLELSTSSDKTVGSLACACLLSLVVARGETGKLLTAMAVLLISLGDNEIPMPAILTSLQRSIHAVLLDSLVMPDWLSHGIPQSALAPHPFPVQIPKCHFKPGQVSITTDSRFLYILSQGTLYKVGSGYAGTIKGQIVMSRGGLTASTVSYAKGVLYAQRCPGVFVRIHQESLREESKELDVQNIEPCASFVDGDSLCFITAHKDLDSFLVWSYRPGTTTGLTYDLGLKLARRCMVAYGTSGGVLGDNEVSPRNISLGSEEELMALDCGKDFGVLRTSSGKVFLRGRSQELGVKPGRWSELGIVKSPRITQCAVGHEGQHGLLLAQDGTVYFVGLSRRGEDGDFSKGRRQPKHFKAKKMTKMSGHLVAYVSCNNGTSALVTRDGELFLFGKDTASTDHITGLVPELSGITQVALGKAHVVALNSLGQVYTFGINHKGQCGRSFHLRSTSATAAAIKEALAPAMPTPAEEDDDEVETSTAPPPEEFICPPGKHWWRAERCMVCTVCGECTGYGAGCIAQGRPNRCPGWECGCGAGDSGCGECGCCRSCAKVPEVLVPGVLVAGGMDNQVSPDLMLMDIRPNQPPSPKNNGQGRNATRLDERLETRIRRRWEESKHRQMRKCSVRLIKAPAVGNKGSRGANSVQRAGNDALEKANFVGPGEESVGSDHERETTKLSSLPPAQISLPSEQPVIQVACGLHHSVLLLRSGEVLTFGSNQHGQLGLGDFTNRGCPSRVSLAAVVTQVAAGSNHTVFLTEDGQVYTCGNHSKGQLCRPPEPRHLPARVPDVGSRRKATWIGASGDMTFIKVDECLVSEQSLAGSSVVATPNSLVVVPHSTEPSFNCLLINKADGSCRSFSSEDQANLQDCAICMDPVYNVLWSYSSSQQQVSRYAIVAAEAKESLNSGWNILSPELALPSKPGTLVGQDHAALHLLACLDTLAPRQMAPDSRLTRQPTLAAAAAVARVYTREDFSIVNRFESHGGGWGYSGHSIEAIRFMADTDILLGGFGLFGGRGEYTAKLKVVDLGLDGGDQEIDGDTIVETEELPYECGARQKYHMLFEEPVPLQANRWYLAWARVSGPSSDCGSSGLSVVTTEDQVIFCFKSSKKSNNGTDVNAGQIPQLLYKVITPDSSSAPISSEHQEAPVVLSRHFAKTVTPESVNSLLRLLRWAWQTFKANLCELSSAAPDQAVLLDLERLVFICAACLHLLKIYIAEIYPNTGTVKKQPIGDQPKMSESVADARTILQLILSDQVSSLPLQSATLKKLLDQVLEECHATFLACFHTFYPSAALRWQGLCDLLLTIDVPWAIQDSDHLLAAVLAALCEPNIQLISTLPILENSSSGEPERFPVLVETMTARAEREGCHPGPVAFQDVLEHLLSIVAQPLRQDSSNARTHSPHLIRNTCALLAVIVAELAHHSFAAVTSTPGQTLHVTPSRFTRVSQNRIWNTGNGSPDAICFSIDRPGIMLAGVSVYGGIGNEWHYDLEMVEYSENEPQLSQRWMPLTSCRGSFGPEDCIGEIADLKLDAPVPLKEGTKYAVLLRNHGARTYNGDGGLAQVKGPDGTTFTFSDCSLSLNGTNHARGQVPQLAYYSSAAPSGHAQESAGSSTASVEARRALVSVCSAVVRLAADLLAEAQERADLAEILSSSHLVTMLLPLMLAHLAPLASSDPRSAVQVLGLVQELLPLVAVLNKRALQSCPPIPATTTETTSPYYTVVESEHPYRPASTSYYRAVFPGSVRWVTLEFDLRSSTSQPEDSLQVWVPGYGEHRYWPALQKLSGGPGQWPTHTIILPGHKVVFSLETASDYVKEERSEPRHYGFRCQVSGFQSPPLATSCGLPHLEKELAYLGGAAAAALMRRDLPLPPACSGEDSEEDSVEQAEQVARQVMKSHGAILGRGLALAQPPSIQQALDGALLPFARCNEWTFLRELVSATGGSPGARLARWLQPEPHVEPRACQLVADSGTLLAGWPVSLILTTRDQYGQVALAPHLKVEVRAVPYSSGDSGSPSMAHQEEEEEAGAMFGGHPPPPQDLPYEVTVKDKMFYHAISCMKSFENYSFEELRLVSLRKRRTVDTMVMRNNNDGTYTASWSPGGVGWYCLQASVDGFDIGNGSSQQLVEVKEPPQGSQHLPPSVPRPSHQPSRLRKFVSAHSSGLRIRSHPSLQSEQIGLVRQNEVVSYIEEIHNDDGVWLQLSTETIRTYCQNGFAEAWCLQYNQHLGRTLLVPVEEPKSLQVELPKERDPPPPPTSSSTYHVVRCGASGHNVRSRPSLRAPPVGMLVLGSTFKAMDIIHNSEGTWVKLDSTAQRRFGFGSSSDGDAWSLAASSQATFLEGDIELEDEGYNFSSSVNQPPSFGHFSSNTGIFTFGSGTSDQEGGSSGSASPFIFGSPASTPSTSLNTLAESERTDSSGGGRVAALQKWLRECGQQQVEGNPAVNLPSELQGVSVKELVKTLNEIRTNGNPTTPPSARRTPRRPSQQSDSSVSSHFGSILKELSQNPAAGCVMSCITQRNTVSPLSTPGTPKKEEVKSVAQAGTQTSPEMDIKGHFSIGSRGPPKDGNKSTRSSPKLPRKQRNKRSTSPVLAQAPEKPPLPKEKVKEAISPLIAECLRAVFAAFLWHEGIVHDAMACSSFLKFNPQLQKQVKFRDKTNSPSSGLTKEQRARLRHSVEVTMPTVFHNIFPLEPLSVSPLNANINRNKLRKTSVPIKEEQSASAETPLAESTASDVAKSLVNKDFPQSLQYLVVLWEQIAAAASHAISQHLILPSRSPPKTCKRPKKKKEAKVLTPVQCPNLVNNEGNNSQHPMLEREALCELCGQAFPHPITYHMRRSHPGCGEHSGGKGYNSGGIYCVGWSGNCGDGGMGGQSWYLVCDKCREKCLLSKRQSLQKEKAKRASKKKNSGKCLSPIQPMEPHQVMKNNALFLLELASAALSDMGKMQQSTKVLNGMPIVSEQSTNPFDQHEPGTFQCLEMLGVQQAYDERIGEEFLSKEDIRALQNGAENLRVGFHRSVSVGQGSPPDWSECRVIMTRKRNNSSGGTDGDKTVLCQPSARLTKLVCAPADLLQRPAMQFILQRHDLTSLHVAMQHALRKAACRVYAMQAFHWLLRTVTQPVSLHDLLWWLVASLSPSPPPQPSPEEPEEQDSSVASSVGGGASGAVGGGECEHPLSDLELAGEAVQPLPGTFHALLQAVSDLLMVLPPGSALQLAAMRCWRLRFQPQDHSFLHRSHVFSNISRILADADCEAQPDSPAPGTPAVYTLRDITHLVELRASSRPAMVPSLTDNSTETFWESGDEDRNKIKVLTLTYNSQVVAPHILYVHIDNGRDLGNKVSNIAFKFGTNQDEMRKLKKLDVEARFAGWVNCPLPRESHSVLKVELKGPDNTLRLRQVRLLGSQLSESPLVANQHSTPQIQQKNCEAETLKVFRLLTAQVFGKLVSGDAEDSPLVEASNDLKEHMVGILFSRSKLTHLQKQVCAHIVAAIRKEANRVREEWEALLCSKSLEELPKLSDAYCFEMLSMVLALSGSSVGRAYLAQQAGLLRDLFSLLHTGSARVQRQVTALLRRVLPEVTPQNLATILGVPSLPPSDFNILSAGGPHDPFRLGILDVFLACIAKGLTVQTKVKGSSKGIATCTLATSIHPRDYVGARWWLRGCMARKLVETIIQLLKDMAAGKLTEEWAVVTKSAVAENVLNLTRLEDQYKVPGECLHTPTLWLALASLCVLDQDHVERLSSGHWAASNDTTPRPLCENHDDGETAAIILCSSCGNLCAECDRFLHLHRRTRSHQRQVFKEEEESIRVDLHEGCGRTKLFWVMVLADSKTLKAMVEFREGTRSKATSSSGVCRFCGQSDSTVLLPIGNVCNESECQEHAKEACARTLPCNHPCGGINNEATCLPCLHSCGDRPLKQDGDDMCMICFTEALACAPAIQLRCGHVFHYHCCKAVLTRRWVGPRITFGFSLCPICKSPMEHPVLKSLLEPIAALYEDVKRKALMRLEYEGLHRAEAISTPGGRFYQDPASFAMERYAYYVCYKCGKAYYGGEARCDVEAGPVEDYDPAELVCGGCSDVSRAQMCPKHGTDFLEYKCRYCCSVAVFFCFGSTHFCNACHDDFQHVTTILKEDLPQCPAGPRGKQLEGEECPLHVAHPPTGQEFALGCGVCRNAHTF